MMNELELKDQKRLMLIALIEDCESICEKPRKRKIKWTFEACKEEAIKYKTRSEFQKNSGSSYKASAKNKWLDLICNHMIQPIKPRGYWTVERCREEALKYQNHKDFVNGSKSACNTAQKNG